MIGPDVGNEDGELVVGAWAGLFGDANSVRGNGVGSLSIILGEGAKLDNISRS